MEEGDRISGSNEVKSVVPGGGRFNTSARQEIMGSIQREWHKTPKTRRGRFPKMYKKYFVQYQRKA